MSKLRDIRDDLKARLEDAVAREGKALAEAEMAHEEAETLRELLTRENRRFGNPKSRIRFQDPSTKGASPIRKFLEDSLGDGSAYTLNQLAELAQLRNVEVEKDKSLKRSLNAALLGWQRHGKADKTDQGQWFMTK